jgi:glycosyltransferase involved in cell wall biosynthesis
LPEVAGDAAIYCDPFNVNDIASGMNQLLSDELLCNNLSKLGLKRSVIFSWDAAAISVWNEIEKLLPKSNFDNV